MNPSKRLLPALLALAVYCASAAAVSAVTITTNNALVSLASSTSTGSSSFTGTGIPTSQLLETTLGAYYSRNQIDYTGSGENVTLSNTLSQKRSDNLYDISYGYDALYFTVAANTTYNLSGAYSATDVTTAGSLSFTSHLYDLTTFSYLALSIQYSFSTLNESFVLGGNGGDFSNHFSGSLAGSLIAGHQYLWAFEAYTYKEAHATADGGATATGFLRLDIGGGAPSSVPDGGTTLAMLGLGVLYLAALRRGFLRN